MGNSNTTLQTTIPDDSLSNMEEGIPNELIFTFYIIMHAATININLSEYETKLFSSCRMFSRTGSTCSAIHSSDLTHNNITILKQQLQKDLNNSSYDVINKCIKQNLKPKYIEDFNSELLEEDKKIDTSNCYKTLLRITHDKILSTKKEKDLGIFLLSVHKKNLDGSLSYIPIIYPYLLNLLIISELQKFAEIFGGVVPELISSDINIKKSLKLWSGIELSSDKTQIETIRLSKFIEILNSILKNTGKKCKYNLIDESCSNDIYNQNLKISFEGIDTENTPPSGDFFGGKNKKNKKNKKKIKNTILNQKRIKKNKKTKKQKN